MGFFDNPNLKSGEIIGGRVEKATDEQVTLAKAAVEKLVSELERIFPGEKVTDVLYSLAPDYDTYDKAN